MAKEILLYNYYLSNYSVADMITKLDEAKSESVDMRVNCYGGEVFASWGLFAKVKEHGDVKMKVDGIAASGAGNLLLYAKSVECLSVSRVMLHRADGYAETEAQKALLISMNADLRKQLEMKVDSDSFKAVTGYTIDQMFNPETRVDIWLTATQLKKLGIVTKVVQLTPEQEEDVKATLPTPEASTQFAMKVAALWNPTTQIEEKLKTGDMTIEKLKAEHPAVYAEIVKQSAEAALKIEARRVKAWNAFAKIDAEAAMKGIADGSEVDNAVIAEMTVKALSAEGLKKLTAESPAAPAAAAAGGAPIPQTEKEKNVASFEKDVLAALGRKTVTMSSHTVDETAAK